MNRASRLAKTFCLVFVAIIPSVSPQRVLSLRLRVSDFHLPDNLYILNDLGGL